MKILLVQLIEIVLYTDQFSLLRRRNSQGENLDYGGPIDSAHKDHCFNVLNKFEILSKLVNSQRREMIEKNL